MKTIRITKATFINGENVKDLDDRRIMSLIATAKKELKELEALGVESVAVDKQIAEIKDGITSLVKIMDARVAD